MLAISNIYCYSIHDWKVQKLSKCFSLYKSWDICTWRIFQPVKLEGLTSMHMILWFFFWFFSKQILCKNKNTKAYSKIRIVFFLYRYLNREWKSDVSHVRRSHCCWTETWVIHFPIGLGRSYSQHYISKCSQSAGRRGTITPSSRTDNH